MKKIAISTTLPMEILLATGCQIVDLNNRFVTSPLSQNWLSQAEGAGFPKSLCAWIKGLYSACLAETPDLFIAVTEGDCSNTKGLNAILKHKGISVLSFGYPAENTPENLEKALSGLAADLEVTWDNVLKMQERLKSVRALGVELDRLTYETNQVNGFENHLWLVSFSDFDGNLDDFQTRLEVFIETAKQRPSMKQPVRLAYIGVPPMTADLYDFVEGMGGRVVFNEVQRQFSMPHSINAASLAEQYANYTYPYELEGRLVDIQEAIKERRIDGVIHYTQAFCHRALDDVILRDVLNCPIITIEGDQATALDGRTKLRLEAFIDLLKDSVGKTIMDVTHETNNKAGDACDF